MSEANADGSKSSFLTKKRGFMIGATAIILIISFLAYSVISPYFIRVDPIPSDGYSVIQIEGEIGQTTCMHWVSNHHLLVCDVNVGAIIIHTVEEDILIESRVLKDELDNPHGIHHDGNRLFISEKGKLTRSEIIGDDPSNWEIVNSTILVEGIPSGNHQTNSIREGPDGMLIWHSGSTCNVCEEDDNRNAALLLVDPENGNHSVIASGVRNSFDGILIQDVGYVFTDNGRDWDGDDYPYEELNLLEIGQDYGWPNDNPETPIPNGTLGPIGIFDPHSSANSIALRNSNTTLPGGNKTIFVSVFGSWNSVTPTGGEILKVDLIQDSSSAQGWKIEKEVIVNDAFGVLGIAFNPNGDLYFSNYMTGKMHVIRN